MNYNSIPLTFNSFQFLKKIFNHLMDDKHTENQEFVLEPIKQSSQSMQDLIDDVLSMSCFICQLWT
jgi:DNA topoisomerase IA